MAYTYSGNPGASDRDWIRHKTADIDVSGGAASADFTDEEIAAVFEENGGDKWRAAHTLLLQRGQKFTRLALAAGSGELDAIVRANSATIKAFMSEATQQGININMVADSASTKSALAMDSNRVQPRFRRGMNDSGADAYVPFGTLYDD